MLASDMTLEHREKAYALLKADAEKILKLINYTGILIYKSVRVGLGAKTDTTTLL